MFFHRKGFFLAICLACSVFAGTAAAQEKSDRLTVSDVFHLQYAASPQISPDGKKIVYERHFNDITSDKRCSNLWLINVDGSGHQPLTSGAYSDTSPRWSPDDMRLAYLSDQNGLTQIYVRWMDTGATTAITDLENPPSSIAWSPDGKYVSFAALVPAAPLQIAKLPSPPEGAKWADQPKVYDKLIYRFNGPGYLKPGYVQLFIVAAEGGAPRQITSGNFQHGGPGFRASEPIWTPDSKYLIASVNRRADYEYEPLDTEIYEFSIADGSARQLTHRRGPDNAPAVSPDGKSIAYVGFDDRYQGYQINRPYVMKRDGSGSHLLSEKLDCSVQDPAWAPDGSGIYFVYDDQGDTKLGFYSLGGELKLLASHLGSGGSAYGFGAAYSVARDGTFAFAYTRPDDMGDVAVGRPGSTSVQVITALNKDLFAQKRLGQVEEFWYTSSFDGRKIQGWIIKPPDFDPSKKYPLILEIHGGPFANYGDRFDTEKQMMAAQGYVVAYVNPRGSTSYGEEFGNLIHHRYPGDDFYDLNSGVDAVVAKGYVDPDNLFVTGGSGGGVLTCWMVDRTTRFRAAASLYPVINWYSFVLTADIPSFTVKYWFPGFPWDYPEQYMKRSVLSLVKNVQTPTMLMTGEEDYRTPISEAEQYYEALKLLKVDSVLVRVPGEPHGVRRRPSHEMAKILYIVGWFDQHKKKP